MLPLVVSLLIASVLPGVYNSQDFSRNTNNSTLYKVHTSNLLGSYIHLAIILGAESPLNLDLDRCLKTQYNGSSYRGFYHHVTYRHQRSDNGNANWPHRYINVWIYVSIEAGSARVYITSLGGLRELNCSELGRIRKGTILGHYVAEDSQLSVAKATLLQIKLQASVSETSKDTPKTKKRRQILGGDNNVTMYPSQSPTV
ncbi:hypothetical protein V5799_022376, partial [Amblyomma americanum]